MSADTVLRARSLTGAGIEHGFSTRAGGVSEGPFASMNLGRNVGDDPDAVAENHRRLAASIGYVPERLFESSQVHGSAVVDLRTDDEPAEVRTRRADALVARAASQAVGVRTADCVPVLLADPETGHVAAVHAGWRGVVSNVVREARSVLLGSSGDAGRLIAAIGPSIGPCCFEVDDEVAMALAQAGGDGIVLRRGGGKPHVDLWRAVEHQLRRSGVTRVEQVTQCTMCERERFFSFRRDGAESGRMLSVIVARAR